MQDADAKPHQPDAEAGMRIAARITPGRAAIHQHGERQAITAEGSFELAAHRLALLVAAGRKHQIVARVVVERSERMATPAMHGKVTLEVHLPKLVRTVPLEALPWPGMLARSRFRQSVVTAQDLGDGARRGHVGFTAIRERPLDLPPTPDIVADLANLEHLCLNCHQRSARTDFRSPRPLDQSRQTLPPIALEPFVSGRWANSETSAKFANVRSLHCRKHNELTPLIHYRHLAKWHPNPPDSLIGKVSTMSPNRC
jgi:hypothetical protein